jgi:alpha-glucoside transport system substrate-binding protein
MLDLVHRTCKRLHQSGASRLVAQPATEKGGTMRRTWIRLAAVPVALVLLAAACSTSDDDDSGATQAPTSAAATTTAAESTESTASGDTEATETTKASGTSTTAGASTTSGASTTLPPTPGPGSAGTVTVFGVEDSENEAGAEQDALSEFGQANGIDIKYVGRRDFEQQINAQVLGGNPPDIANFPQPGKLVQFAKDGDVLALPDDVKASVAKNWDQSYLDFYNVDGTQYGVPFKSDLKSLVWYVPSVWEEKGYKVPTTLTEFKTLMDQMIANGDTPLCVGIQSDAFTGWPFTDWVEELVVRENGIDYYNKWVNDEVPFTDQPIVDAFNEVAGPDGMWTKKGAVFSSGGSIAATAFGDNADPLVEGKCMMHRQANFFAAFFPDGTKFGTGPGEVSTFYFPADEGHPVLVGGQASAAFRDAPEVWKVMEYIGSPEFANARQAAQSKRTGGGNSGFLTGNKNADPTKWNEIEQGFLETLKTANPAAYDASDQMPAEVGSGAGAAFLTEATSFVNGDTDAKAAAEAIQQSWPS